MEISKIIDEYLLKFADEAEALSPLIDFKTQFSTNQDLTSRKNFNGHITSSAILVSRQSKKMLKIFHDDLELKLQPGGHIAENNDPLQNARNLLKGLGIENITFVPDTNNELIPLDIDSHTIPVNTEKSEAEHTHHDFRYLFVCEDEIEGKNFFWEDIPEQKKYATYTNLVEKVQLLWSNEFVEKQFYNSIVEAINIPRSTCFITVQHFLPGVDHFFRSLQAIGKILLAIPKPKSLQKEIQERLNLVYPIKEISRENLGSDEDFNKLISDNAEIILFDIGGWFANDLVALSKKYPNKIIGVIEDTENGLQKYLQIPKLPCPVISVARSPLKLNEDTLIGQSIVFSADSILRDQNKLLKYMTCGILGYGKVGKSIAHDLLARSIKPIVFEINPLRFIEAYNDGCSIANRESIFKKCDAIFCATGKKSMSCIDFPHLKSGCYLFSVTSADDEFDLQGIEEFKAQKVHNFVTRYYKFENSFYLVNGGNAVNFLHKAVVGDFIHLVKAEMLLAINELKNNKLSHEVHEVSDLMRRKIAFLWLKHFHNLDTLYREN